MSYKGVDSKAFSAHTPDAKCPIDLEDLKKKIETKFNKEVILDTHPY